MEGMCHYCKHKIKNYYEEPCSSCRATDGKFDGIDIPSPWRDVREELPDIIGSYLVCAAIGAVREIAWAFFNSDKKWVVDSKFVDTVTHWMPLPAPPAGEE